MKSRMAMMTKDPSLMVTEILWIGGLKKIRNFSRQRVKSWRIRHPSIHISKKTKRKKMSNWEKKKRKKELNKKYNDDRKKEKEFYPLKHINRDFMSLANGIVESAKKKK